MKQYKPTGTKHPRLLNRTELARVIGGNGDVAVAILQLEQHVDNPGQTAMKA